MMNYASKPTEKEVEESILLYEKLLLGLKRKREELDSQQPTEITRKDVDRAMYNYGDYVGIRDKVVLTDNNGADFNLLRSRSSLAALVEQQLAYNNQKAGLITLGEEVNISQHYSSLFEKRKQKDKEMNKDYYMVCYTDTDGDDAWITPKGGQYGNELMYDMVDVEQWVQDRSQIFKGSFYICKVVRKADCSLRSVE